MDFNALNSFIDEDNASEGYDDLVGFSEGGPVGEDMEDDEQPSLQYFAQGGEVEEAQAILTRMPKPGRAAQMLQSFAEGGEVQKTPFPELLDISKQVNAAGAPVEKLYAPTTAPASTPVSSQINIPTFQPAAPVPTGPNIITPTPAPLAGLGAPPSLTQPTTAPTTTARSLFEQINPATMAAMPTYTTPSFTPTVQTFNRPTLLTQEELQKAQPPLVRYEPSATYGGLQTYQGPLQTSPYADIPGAPTGGTVAPPPPPAPVNVTPGGYTFATYTTLSPEQLAGVGDKAQVTEAYKGIVTRQQADATAVRNEYNKALAAGDMAMVEQLKPLLVEQEAEFARSKADQAFVNKYFTGVGGAFETPEQYRQRMQDAQFKAQTITGLTGATDVAGLGVPVGTKADPYTTAVTQQTKEYNAALNTYNQLKAVYGDTDFVKNYFSEIVAPQKADVDALTIGPQATAYKTGATAAFNAITAGQAYKVAAPTLAEFRNEQQTIASFAPAIKTFETNISTLTKARDNAANTGLTGYASRLDELLQSETDKYTQTLGQRQSAIDAAQPDPMRDYILGKQMVAQKIDGFVPVDVGGIDFSKMNAALFDPEIARQNKDLTAATNTYNQLVALYTNKSDIAVNFLNDVLNPQKNEVAQATALKAAAAAAIGSFNTGKALPKYTRPAITVNKSTTDAAINKTFDPLIATYNKNISTLDAAKTKAQQAGLDQYTPYFDSLIENEYAKIGLADQDRSNYIDAIPRAMGSPPEGEVADTRSRALLKKLSGGSEANTVPLQKFNKGGAVNKAQGSPVKGETVPTSPPAKDQMMSGIVSEASKLLKNITGKSAPDSTLNMSQYEQMYALKDVGSPEKGRKAALNVYSSLLPALMRARFPDYVANSPARVLKEGPRGAENMGEFDVFYRTIALDPGGVNSMLMEPYGKYGYVGMGSNTTTDETLNALGTLLHESMHARTRGAEGKKRSAPHPVEQLKKAMPKDRFDEMIRDIRVSELPSVYSAPNPAEVINEYFATATPVKHMVDKDMVTKRSRRYLAEVDRLAKKYPELEKMRVTWERPELFFKD
jgi:hypothetical protein